MGFLTRQKVQVASSRVRQSQPSEQLPTAHCYTSLLLPPTASVTSHPQQLAQMASVDFSYLQDALAKDAELRERVREATREIEQAERACLAVLGRVHSHSREDSESHITLSRARVALTDEVTIRSPRPRRLPRPDSPCPPYRTRQTRRPDPASAILPLQRLVLALHPTGELYRGVQGVSRAGGRCDEGGGCAAVGQ